MNRTAIALVATATLGLGGLGAVTLLPETAAQAEASSTLRTQVFSIEKMTCATCVCYGSKQITAATLAEPRRR